MSPAGNQTSCSGVNRYHGWGMVVPVMAALAPCVILHPSVIPSGMPQWARSATAGVVTGIVAYFLFSTVPVLREDRKALGKAMLLGLLVSEMTVYSSPEGLPSLTSIAFFIMMYGYGTAEVEPGLHWIGSCHGAEH